MYLHQVRSLACRRGQTWRPDLQVGHSACVRRLRRICGPHTTHLLLLLTGESVFPLRGHFDMVVDLDLAIGDRVSQVVSPLSMSPLHPTTKELPLPYLQPVKLGSPEGDLPLLELLGLVARHQFLQVPACHEKVAIHTSPPTSSSLLTRSSSARFSSNSRARRSSSSCARREGPDLLSHSPSLSEAPNGQHLRTSPFSSARPRALPSSSWGLSSWAPFLREGIG